jgi:Putative metal-binding motif
VLLRAVLRAARSGRAARVWLNVVGLLVGCGAKDIGESPAVGSGLLPQEPPVELPVGAACSSKADCQVADKCSPRSCEAGVCVALPVACDDGDPCTVDQCQSNTGACEFLPLTEDLDNDGESAFISPISQRTAPILCATDCDDSRSDINSMARELCDGADNNCDGVIDEGYNYFASTRAPILVSTQSPRADLGGVAYNGTHYVVSLAEALDRNQTELIGLDGSGMLSFTEAVARTNSDSYPGPLLFRDGSLVSAWEDRRDDDFEIYFNRFDGNGQKLGPDLRISDAPGFSLGAGVEALDSGYLVTWADRRSGQQFQVYGQRVTFDSELEPSGNVNLTPDIERSESPSVAVGSEELGMVFNSEQGELQIFFRTLSFDLATLGPLVFVATGVGAGISYVQGNYVTFWYEYGVLPGDAIWGAVLSPLGEFVVAPRRVTASAPFARGHSVVNLGDRLLLAWAEFQGEQYDIWQQTFDLALSPLTAPQQVTSGGGDALSPALALGGNGEVGLAYTQRANGGIEVWFTTLTCQ